MELLCATTVSMASYFAVIERDSINAGLAGLSIAYALQLTFVFNMLVRQSADVETQVYIMAMNLQQMVTFFL